MTQMEQQNPRNISGGPQIFGWCMYDWANSAYVTTVVAGVLPIYFASAIVGKGGVQIGNAVVSADALWGYLVSASAMFVFLFAPVLGAISDFSASKKKFLITLAYTGSISATLLYFCQSGDVWRTAILFLIAQIGYVGANVFYDAFLPQIASEDRIDWVSSKGFSYGYIGGGLQFAITLGLVAGGGIIGIGQGLAARMGIGNGRLMVGGFYTLYAQKTERGGSDRGDARKVPIATEDSRLYRHWHNANARND